jgi:RNA polymerase sigma factor (sigma-70 family)
MAIETLGAALRQIKRLFADGVATGLSDGHLLELFIDRRDAAAFEALLARHGPMVLSVCRTILRDSSDVEDAFQATFLVLVKKARTIRGRQTVGGWLHQVARRVAVQASRAAARRRAREREVGLMAAAKSASGPAVVDQLLPALHEEIGRLPEKLRLAIVHCDLGGMTHAQAASALRWSERTTRRRLAEAREKIKDRLRRRGLEHDQTLLEAVLIREAHGLVPPAWREATVRAALDILSPAVAVSAVSGAAQSLTHEVLKAMFLQKVTTAAAAFAGAALLVWAASAALVLRGDEPARKAEGPAPAPRARRASPPLAQPRRVEPDRLDAAGTFPVRGRVLDPDGKPVAGAEVLIRHFTPSGWSWTRPEMGRRGQRGRVATSAADGRFHFDLDKESSDWPWGDEPAWHQAQIAAVAPGLALAWADAGSLLKGDEAILRLVRDDVPVRGRVLDAQGRPVAGSTVRIRQIAALANGVDPDAMLALGELESDQTAAWYGDVSEAPLPGAQNTLRTGADGRFEIRGIGRDRIGALDFRGPMHADGTLYVMARASTAQPKPRPRPAGREREMLFHGSPPKPLLVGAIFDYIVGPAKPITGVIRSKATGKPLAGIKVVGQEGATWTSVVTRTDEAGRFRLAGLPKGEVYKLEANQGYGAVLQFQSAQITVTDTEGLKPIETTLELPKGVMVTGRLIDPLTGGPVPLGQVSYCKLPTNHNDGDGAETLKRLADLTFRLTVPPGEGMVFVTAWGKDLPYARARLRKADKGKGVGGIGDGETYMVPLNGHHAYKIVDIPAAAESFHLDLELTRGLSRKGRVVGPDGQPVSGAQCYGTSATWGEMKTLAGDTFEALGLEPDYPRQLIFAHQGRRLVGSVIIRGLESRSEEPLVVRLDRPGSLTGRLLDEDNLPIAGATLSTLSIALDGSNLPPGPGPQAMWPDSETVTSGPDGRFQIDGLKPGVKTNSGVTFKDRPGVYGDAGMALRDIVIRKHGEIRDLGDIKVKIVRR